MCLLKRADQRLAHVPSPLPPYTPYMPCFVCVVCWWWLLWVVVGWVGGLVCATGGVFLLLVFLWGVGVGGWCWLPLVWAWFSLGPSKH